MPGPVDMVRATPLQKLTEIARFAIGSNEADSTSEIKGGSGRIGFLNGRVVKFNTHALERSFGPKASLEMRESCNALRQLLHESAQEFGVGNATLAKIREKLKLDANGRPAADAALLDRSTVASVINLIGADKKQDIWSRLRSADIKDLSSDGKDTHFAAVKAGLSGPKPVADVSAPVNADFKTAFLSALKGNLSDRKGQSVDGFHMLDLDLRRDSVTVRLVVPGQEPEALTQKTTEQPGAAEKKIRNAFGKGVRTALAAALSSQIGHGALLQGLNAQLGNGVSIYGANGTSEDVRSVTLQPEENGGFRVALDRRYCPNSYLDANGVFFTVDARRSFVRQHVEIQVTSLAANEVADANEANVLSVGNSRFRVTVDDARSKIDAKIVCLSAEEAEALDRLSAPLSDTVKRAVEKAVQGERKSKKHPRWFSEIRDFAKKKTQHTNLSPEPLETKMFELVDQFVLSAVHEEIVRRMREGACTAQEDAWKQLQETDGRGSSAFERILYRAGRHLELLMGELGRQWDVADSKDKPAWDDRCWAVMSFMMGEFDKLVPSENNPRSQAIAEDLLKQVRDFMSVHGLDKLPEPDILYSKVCKWAHVPPENIAGLDANAIRAKVRSVFYSRVSLKSPPFEVKIRNDAATARFFVDTLAGAVRKILAKGVPAEDETALFDLYAKDASRSGNPTWFDAKKVELSEELAKTKYGNLDDDNMKQVRDCYRKQFEDFFGKGALAKLAGVLATQTMENGMMACWVNRILQDRFNVVVGRDRGDAFKFSKNMDGSFRLEAKMESKPTFFFVGWEVSEQGVPSEIKTKADSSYLNAKVALTIRQVDEAHMSPDQTIEIDGKKFAIVPDVDNCSFEAKFDI